MKISVEEALVKTATVEIKSLSIGGKQITLAVFRQLQEESVVDYELLRLNGPVWGKINYHPDKFCSGDHIHLVWQSGTELRRSYVGKDSNQRVMHQHQSREPELFKQLVVAFAGKGGRFVPTRDYSYVMGNREFVIEGIKGDVFFQQPDPLAQLLTANDKIAKGQGEELERDTHPPKSYNQIAQEAVAILKPRSVEEAKKELLSYQLHWAAYKKDWETLYAKLKEVQQLFIAV